MDKEDKVKAWQDKIIDTFIGPNGWNGERIFKLDQIEKDILVKINANIKGFIYIMDAFFDFLIETFEISVKNKIKWNNNGPLYFCIQVICFWRLRASYIIFGKGYYAEALSLLRGIYENVLLIESVNQGVITLDEVLGKLKIEDTKDLPREKIEKMIRKITRSTDLKIKNYFFGPDSNLSSESKRLLKSFERNMHNAVHKSKLNFFHYYSDWINGKRGLPIFPHYNEDLASVYANSCTWVSWMLLKILPLFLLNIKSFGDNWYNKLKVLDQFYREMIENFPRPTGKAVIELVAKLAILVLTSFAMSSHFGM